jgi:hypothetical protein
LQSQNENGQNVLHATAEGNVAVQEKLWDFATEEHRKQHELKINFY